MRMRKKKHGAERLAACADYVISERDQLSHFPVHLEIGCGKGSFISQLSRACPDVQYVAMEKIPDVLLLAAEKIRNDGTENVKFIVGDAKNLTEIFKPGDISRIYLNFSDPWPKSKHHKRRLTHESFLQLYKSLLTPDGEIFFKTDNRDLFDFSLEEFEKCGFKLRNVTNDLHAEPCDTIDFRTEYETIFSQKGFKINRVEAYL